jgi:FkbM family methyltransferase
MPLVRTWISKLILRAPATLKWVRSLPIAGGIVHNLSHRILKTDEKLWVKIQSGPAQGIWLELNPRTGQSYMRGDTESLVQEDNDVFFDLGANIGLFTLMAARAIGAKGAIFSFEPDSENAARLRRNIARNGFENISVVEAGVWSSTGKRQFAASESTSPDRGVGTFIDTNSRATDDVSIQCTSLDDFIKSAPLPTAIKCDVEGAEFEVVKGATNLLHQQRPWILFEMHSQDNDRRIRTALRDYRYSFQNIDEFHVVAEPLP